MAKRRRRRPPSLPTPQEGLAPGTGLDSSLLSALGIDPSIINDLAFLNPNASPAVDPGARPRLLSFARFQRQNPGGLTPEGLGYEQYKANLQEQLKDWQKANELFRNRGQQTQFGLAAQDQIMQTLMDLGNLGQGGPGSSLFNPIGSPVGFQAEQFAQGLRQQPLAGILGGQGRAQLGGGFFNQRPLMQSLLPQQPQQPQQPNRPFSLI